MLNCKKKRFNFTGTWYLISVLRLPRRVLLEFSIWLKKKIRQLKKCNNKFKQFYSCRDKKSMRNKKKLYHIGIYNFYSNLKFLLNKYLQKGRWRVHSVFISFYLKNVCLWYCSKLERRFRNIVKNNAKTKAKSQFDMCLEKIVIKKVCSAVLLFRNKNKNVAI